jgi:hypothetical protein
MMAELSHANSTVKFSDKYNCSFVTLSINMYSNMPSTNTMKEATLQILIVTPLVIFPTIHRIQSFSFTTLSQLESIPSCPVSLRATLMLSSNLHLGPQNGLFCSGHPINII